MLYNHWLSQPEEKILLGAHRGCGDSFFGPKPSKHRENTFNSFEHACAAIEDEKADFIHADLIVTGDKHVICYSNIGLAIHGKKTMVHSQNFHKIKEAAKDGKIKNFEQLDGEVSRSKLRMCGLSDVEKGWDLVEVKDLLENLPEDYGTGTPVNFEIKYAAVMMDNKTEADVAPNYENLNNYREYGENVEKKSGENNLCVFRFFSIIFLFFPDAGDTNMNVVCSTSEKTSGKTSIFFNCRTQHKQGYIFIRSYTHLFPITVINLSMSDPN